MWRITKWLLLVLGGTIIYLILRWLLLYGFLSIALNDGFADHVLSKPMTKWESEEMDVYVIDDDTILVEIKEGDQKMLYYATYHISLSEFVISLEPIAKTDPLRENSFTFSYSVSRNTWRLYPDRGNPLFDESKEIILKRQREQLEAIEIPIS